MSGRQHALIALLLVGGLRSEVAIPAADERVVVIRNASVFDAHSATMHTGRTVVIRGDRIADVRAAGDAVSLPPGATTIDAAGQFLIPGLIDAHVHLVHLADRTHVTGDEFLPLFLAAGVTSVRSTGDAIVAEAGVAHFSDSHPGTCPRVFLAGPLIDGDPPFHRDVGYALTDPKAVGPFVDDMARWHVTTLKLYVGATRQIGQKVIEHGHRRGMKVTGHLGHYAAQDAAADGIDCLEHIWSVFNYSIPNEVAKQPDIRSTLDLQNEKCQSLIALLANRKVAVDPTLVVFRNMIYLNDLPEVHGHPDNATVPKRMRDYWEGYRKGSTHKPETQPSRRAEIKKYQELTGLLHRAHVPILVGTDAPEPFVPPGTSLHQELEMLVESGLSPGEAIQSATRNNASIINQGSRLGAIEAGRLADLVILDADPTIDIRNTRRISRVIIRGHVARPADLRKLVPVE